MLTFIFVVQNVWSKRDEARFGVLRYLENGIRILVLDVSAYVDPGLTVRPPQDAIFPGYLKKVVTLEDFKSAFENADSASTAVFMFIAFEGEIFRRLFNVVSTLGLRYAVTYTNALPPPGAAAPPAGQSALRSLVRALLYPCIRAWRRIAALRTSLALQLRLPVRPPAWILAGGRRSIDGRVPSLRWQKRVIWAHTLDYDLYLAARQVPLASKGGIVFLDEFLPYHTDYIAMGIEPFDQPGPYFACMNAFFKRLEDLTGQAVVIAAHPRSDYEDRGNPYEGRQIVRSGTPGLTAGADLVVAHTSTSLNFANLFERAIVFVTTRNMDPSYSDRIAAMALWHGQKMWSIDESGRVADSAGRSAPINSIVDEARHCRYNEYREGYIKTAASPQKYSWQIIEERVRRDLALQANERNLPAVFR